MNREAVLRVAEELEGYGPLFDGTLSTAILMQLAKELRSAVAAAPEPVAWLIEYTAAKTRLAPAGISRRVVFTHNAIADYRDIDPNATSTPLYR